MQMVEGPPGIPKTELGEKRVQNVGGDAQGDGMDEDKGACYECNEKLSMNKRS